jgi:hypothetical protein
MSSATFGVAVAVKQRTRSTSISSAKRAIYTTMNAFQSKCKAQLPLDTQAGSLHPTTPRS